jgi:hypothetical protein
MRHNGILGGFYARWKTNLGHKAWTLLEDSIEKIRWLKLACNSL